MKTTKDYTIRLICGMILFAALFSCKGNGTTDTPLSEITGEDNFHTKIIDGCEYIYKYCGYQRGYVFTHKGNCKNHDNKYTLIQSDSPHLPNYHPEIDLISNDTIYVNWYSNDKAPFYDGEGNVIPDKIVRLFVQSITIR
ncbi:MAG: hypothetical protein IPJ81_06545 [Chitinophagaceae bacterium]|nr:hypothetical protein [Chitinophagaceae bacterium]